MLFEYNGISTSDDKLVFFLGPCVIESKEIAFTIAKELKSIADRFNIQVVFKGSYDKANRTSISSFRSIGMIAALEILGDIKKEFGLQTITDVHTPDEIDIVAKYVDFLQIPAFLCRQTDMLLAAQDTGLALLVKKGQFVSGYDTEFIASKCSRAIEEKRFLLCERGTTFGYGDLVVDMRNLAIMKRFAPVVYDGTHSLQMPSTAGGVSGGNRELIPPLLYASIGSGLVSAIFMEVHPTPKESLSDSATIFPLNNLRDIIENVLILHEAVLKLKKINIIN